MLSGLSSSERWQDLAILTGVAVLVHGLLLLDTGIYWDDWVVYIFVVKREWPLLSAMVRERGIVPVEQYYWWLLGSLPVFAYKAAGFVMIVGSSWLAAQLGRTSTFLSRQESMLVALVMLCYSGFQDWVLFSTSHYTFFYCLFLTGALLALQAERETGWRHWIRRVATLVLFAASYGLASLLVLTMVFAGCLLLYIKKLNGASWLRLVGWYLPRRLDYVALPIVYWYGVKRLLPPQGIYAKYNELLTSASDIWTMLKRFATSAIDSQLRRALEELSYQPLVIALAFALAVGIWWLGRRRSEAPPTAVWWLLPFAVLWTTAAMLPYAAVAKPATAIGWDTRHAVLVSFPLGVTMVALARLLGRPRARHLPLAGVVAVVTICAGMALATIHTYLELQVRAIKDRSVMHQLASLPLTRDTSVFWLRDRMPKALGESYRYYEWAGMFERAFGDQRRVAFDRETYPNSDVLKNDTQYFTNRYRLKDFDPAGCQADLSIDWGRMNGWGFDPQSNRLTLVRTYHWVRMFAGPETLSRFLDEVSTVTLTPVVAAEAVHCVR
jgi:hypothetical protein